MTFAEQRVEDFLDELAAGNATPGGGAAAAITGAAGAALGEMVCNLTVGREEYEAVEADLQPIMRDLGSTRARLLDLADEDAAAFDALMEAYRTPADEDRAVAIQAATKRATEVPLETAEACLSVIEHATTVTELGNENAITDGGTGALLAHAALRAALYNVAINISTLEDEAFVAETSQRADEIESAADAALETVQANVDSLV